MKSILKAVVCSSVLFSVYSFILTTDSGLAQGQESPLAAGTTAASPTSSDNQNPGMSEMRWRNEKIRQALNEPTSLIYDETPWSEVEAELEERFRFNIQLDQSARDDSLTDDEPLTCDLTGIPFKNALRLALREKNATFLIRNGVLLIISLDDAEDVRYFEHSFINVRPLLAQIKTLEKARIGQPRIRRCGHSSNVVPVVGGGGVFRVVNQAVGQQVASEVAQTPASQPAPSPVLPVELVTAESLLIDLIHSSIASDSWKETGQGLATLQIIGGYVVLNTTAESSDELRDFLQDLNYNLSRN